MGDLRTQVLLRLAGSGRRAVQHAHVAVGGVAGVAEAAGAVAEEAAAVAGGQVVDVVVGHHGHDGDAEVDALCVQHHEAEEANDGQQEALRRPPGNCWQFNGHTVL